MNPTPTIEISETEKKDLKKIDRQLAVLAKDLWKEHPNNQQKECGFVRSKGADNTGRIFLKVCDRNEGHTGNHHYKFVLEESEVIAPYWVICLECDYQIGINLAKNLGCRSDAAHKTILTKVIEE